MSASDPHENSLATTASPVPNSSDRGELPDGWLAVESMDIDAQGIARRPDGKVVFIEGALPFEVVSANVHRKKNQLGSRRGHRGSPRVLAARAPRLSTFRFAHRRLRRLQDAAPARNRPGGGQAAGAGRQPLAPGQGEARNDAAAHRRPGLGLPLPSAPVGAPCAQKGRGADRFSRAQEPLCRRHAGVPRAAAACERPAHALARADLRHGRPRNLSADRAGLWRRGDGDGVAPPGAAE